MASQSLVRVESIEDNEMDYVDEDRCIRPTDSDTLNMRAIAASLPNVPTHDPSVSRAKQKPVRLTPEEDFKVAMIEPVYANDDDGDDDDEDEDFQPEEEEGQKKSKKRKKDSTSNRGPYKKNAVLAQVNLLLDALQNMHQEDRTDDQCLDFLRSQDWSDKKIADYKMGLMSLMQVSNKSATATETTMMRYLSGLQNDHPDAVLADQCREMPYKALQKATSKVQDEIFDAEMYIKNLKNDLKIHKFFLEVHAGKTQDRCDWMNWCFQKISDIELRRFFEASSKTSARKEFGAKRGGGGGGSGSGSGSGSRRYSNEI